jgi:molybdenum cofactor synthesis domain-containing protein
MVRRAAALVVGNEILTGKVVEANVEVLARMLFESGVRLDRVVVCRDDERVIAEEVTALRAKHDLVFTSGGVGPTHDDVTVPAVARAFGVRLRRDAELERRIRDHFGERTTEGHLRMADVPEGGELLSNARVQWPVLQVANVFVLPGVPEIFHRKLEVVRERLGASAPFLSAAVYTRCDEGEIAALLERIEREHRVLVGSYPRFDDADHSVKVTFDGTDRAAVVGALDACVAAIPAADVVRIVRPDDDVPPGP